MLTGRQLGIGRRAVLLGLATSLTAACRSATASPKLVLEPVVLATGSPVGVYFEYGTAFRSTARGIGPVDVRSTTGSVENLRMLIAGVATLAFCAADAGADAFNGAGNAQPETELRALGRLYDDYIHLVVPAGSAITSIDDLRGLVVCVGASGSGTAIIADRLLIAAGLDPKRDINRQQLSLDDSATRLRTGAIEAFFWSGGLPTLAITALAKSMPVRLIDLAHAARLLRAEFGTPYRVATIPDATYPGSKVVSTAAVPNHLITTTELSADYAQRLTRALFDSAPTIGRTVPVAARLDSHTAIYTEPIPLHDGAIAYYRSVAVDV